VAADVAPNSPPPGATIADIIALFANKFNLTAKDLAVLSGIYAAIQSIFITSSYLSEFSYYYYDYYYYDYFA
jgi:hypothetical protein